tara:strand:- start:17486 stop:18139 length:654 start_codon:yes stop_codon:yes gene_type:complete
MGKMSELDLVKQDIQQISDDIESSRPEIYEESSLISKHQHVSEAPTPQDVVKSRSGFDYVDEGYMRWRLNQHYPIWSWEIIKYETLGDKAIVVHGRLKIMDEGIPRSFDSVAAHRIAQARSGSGYVDLGNDLKAANSDAFKVAVNRLCNVADDVYRKQYIDKTLSQNQYDKMLLLMSQLDVQEAEKVEMALTSGKITKDNYDKVVSKLKPNRENTNE